jgi:lipid II:glycine glycyltransferase (peptidoglycan interpeptide bridge formation enzyme)
MEVQQSPLYAQYMKRLKWNVEAIEDTNVFYRKFPLVGTLAKIHRPPTLPSWTKLSPFLEKNHIRRIVLEPVSDESQEKVNKWVQKLPRGVRLNSSPFLPTKTILIDLQKSEEKIFDSFTEAKRRAVRRARALGVTVEESEDITKLIHTKNTSAGFMGFVTTNGVRELWETFTPLHATTLLAFGPNNKTRPIGAVLLLFWQDKAYYWIAAGTKEGKKQFAPTLLVHEALKVAKKRKAKYFDFVGVWDERIPKQNLSWKGFTKFKEGFGGETLYYPLAST